MELVFFWVALVIVAITCSEGARIGVNYGTQGNNLPPPAQVVRLLKQHGFSNVRIFNADDAVLKAFQCSGITVAITVETPFIPAIAADIAAAYNWISTHVLPYSCNLVDTVIVGNEVLKYAPSIAPLLLPGMQNIYSALRDFGLATKIKVSTSHAFDVLAQSYPPSAGLFDPDFVPIIGEILGFLKDSASYFLVNIYPYFAYANSSNIPLDYALGSKGFVNKGIHYNSLFDAQLDALYYAMKKLHYEDVGVVVTEAGWPSEGGIGATIHNAEIYNRNLVTRVLSGTTSPLKHSSPVGAYIFALFDENEKLGKEEERHFGLFRPNKSIKYNVTIPPRW